MPVVADRYKWRILAAPLCLALEPARGSVTGTFKVGDLAGTLVSSAADQGKQVLSMGWAAHSDCAIPRGHDILDSPRRLPLHEAYNLCSATKDCVAFTFEGKDPGLQQVLSSSVRALVSNGASSETQKEERLWVHFKSRFKCIKASWTTYHRLPPPQGQEDEKAAVESAAEAVTSTSETTAASRTTDAALESDSTSTTTIQILERDVVADVGATSQMEIPSATAVDDAATSQMEIPSATAVDDTAANTGKQSTEMKFNKMGTTANTVKTDLSAETMERLAAEQKAEEGRLAVAKKAEEELLAVARRAAEKRLTLAAEQKAEEERVAAERKAEEERPAAEQKAEEERLAAETKATQEQLAAEQKAKEERSAAEKKAEEERLEAAQKAEEEHLAEEKKAEEERLAEQKAKEERLAAEKKAEEERLAAEQQAKEERLAAEKKAEEERLAAEQKIKTPESPPAAMSNSRVALKSAREGNGVALCLLGHPGVLEHTHKSLTTNLVVPLQHPDVFIHTLQEGELRELYSLRSHVVNSSGSSEDVYTAFMQRTVDGVAHLKTTYRGIGGNWLGAECLDPVIEDEGGRLRPGSALCIYHGQRQCLNMIVAQESLRGFPYAKVVVSRLDFEWLAPHPPLKLLSNSDVWIPSGSDWGGGINIRHAVLSRDAADGYLSDAFDMVVQGTAAKAMVEAFGSNKVFGYPGLGIEKYLKARLLYRNFTVQRFPNVAYIACTHRQQWRAKSRGGLPQCFGAMGRDAPGWSFRDEQGHAARVVACVRGSWNARKLTSCADDVSHLYPDM